MVAHGTHWPIKSDISRTLLTDGLHLKHCNMEEDGNSVMPMTAAASQHPLSCPGSHGCSRDVKMKSLYNITTKHRML